MNIYIGNLALADVIISTLYIPFQFQAALLNKWALPAFMCKMCPFVQVGPRSAKNCKSLPKQLASFRRMLHFLKSGTQSTFVLKNFFGGRNSFNQNIYNSKGILAKNKVQKCDSCAIAKNILSG